MVSIADKRIHAFIPRTFIITISAIVCGLAIFCYPCFADSDSKGSESVSNSDILLYITESLREQELNLNETSSADAVRAVDYSQLIYNYLTQYLDVTITDIHSDLYQDSFINVLSLMKNAFGIFSQSDDGYLAELTNKYYGSSTGIDSASIKDYIFDIYRVMTNNANIGINQTLNAIASSTGATSTNTYVTNNKLDVMQSTLNNIKNLSWHDWKTVSDFVAYKSSLDQSVITGQTVSSSNPNPAGNYYAQFTGNNVYANTSGMVIDVCLPMYSRSIQKSLSLRSVAYDDNRLISYWQSFTYYDNYTVHFIIFLLEPLPIVDPINFVFHIDSGNWILANNAQGAINNAYIKYIDFTEEDYHVLNMSISQDIEGRNVHAIRQLLTNIENEVASPDMVAAKEESTPQIDEFYDKFTGDGSSAATVSDISNASEISDSVTSGLSTGQNIDDALGVFNPASAFFGWFSTDNAQYFTVYTPQRSIDNWDNIVWTDDEPVLHNVLEEGIYK